MGSGGAMDAPAGHQPMEASRHHLRRRWTCLATPADFVPKPHRHHCTSPVQTPRLSSMLRAALSSAPSPSSSSSSSRASRGAGAGGGSSTTSTIQLPDLQQLLQQRNELLVSRQRERADMQVSSARSQLVAVVLGAWKGAPKAARDDFEKYMRGKPADHRKLPCFTKRLPCSYVAVCCIGAACSEPAACCCGAVLHASTSALTELHPQRSCEWSLLCLKSHRAHPACSRGAAAGW
jgi:hypothetical protein